LNARRTVPPFALLLLVLALPNVQAQTPTLDVTLTPLPGPFHMGQTPTYTGTITNHGPQTLHGLVVYLTIVSLRPGDEHPIALEDWSATPAMRVDAIGPNASVSRLWTMRLLASGPYGISLTVIDPAESHPIVSQIVRFDVQPKAVLSSSRILPVAIGEPLLVLGLAGAAFAARSKGN
jgi:hypothetical protein